MEYVTMCPEHAPMAETLMYAALRGQTTAAGIRKMSLEWEEALDALYEKQAQVERILAQSGGPRR